MRACEAFGLRTNAKGDINCLVLDCGIAYSICFLDCYEGSGRYVPF